MALRFVMVGGFLGAGKTTTLGRLARHYQAQGKRVGIVTNDQAAGLVDTVTLRQQGWAVEEVAGACFCCRFDELMQRVGALQAAERPEVILAEPVGSCTDLVATVIQPLRHLYGQQVQVAPYVVLFKPSHGQRILRGPSQEGTKPGGFSPKAAYIFRKQLEEADVIALNRIDELTAAEREELVQLVRQHYPQTPLLCLSARTGEGFDALVEWLEQEGGFGRRILDIDYDIYAAGEAELGWLNAATRWQSSTGFALDEIVLEVVQNLTERCQQQGAEIAHLKGIGWEEGGSYAVANAITSAGGSQLSLASRAIVQQAEVIINARVAVEPEWLAEQLRQVLAAEGQQRNIAVELVQMQSLRPGRPVPTHRYAQAYA
ncbi:MAG: GTP-binding protein [Thermogemmata sp.]|jgi:G3E family GTPase|uniref:Cobalamin biosynthesis protein P47K n=1 Tax=Thermogemmata fonticola TaxID=2755323 RepID=A0A7V9ABM1_9BACT|nr:GTP-binding protein [Thermogemmata fonticola]MBA2226148.1 cobalamin biosynthesis protein P47K [Thermogemmata fonticola]MCX8139733.1 cobalamin biosynthesis protein P47K [Gemmataceae bacterium]